MLQEAWGFLLHCSNCDVSESITPTVIVSKSSKRFYFGQLCFPMSDHLFYAVPRSKFLQLGLLGPVRAKFLQLGTVCSCFLLAGPSMTCSIGWGDCWHADRWSVCCVQASKPACWSVCCVQAFKPSCWSVCCIQASKPACWSVCCVQAPKSACWSELRVLRTGF